MATAEMRRNGRSPTGSTVLEDLGAAAEGCRNCDWKARGKRRIHDKPSWSEVAACRPWLDGELDAVKPDVLVLLGATAAQDLLGRSFRVTKARGVPIEDTGLARYVLATVHPSAILRERDGEARHTAKSLLVADLCAAAALL